jgi:hypothetical protein
LGAAAAQEGAKWERRQREREQKREQKREQNGSGDSARGSKRGSKMGAVAAQEGAKAGAGCGFPVWFPRLLPLSAGVLTCAIAQECHAHFSMPLAVDRSLPVDVVSLGARLPAPTVWTPLPTMMSFGLRLSTSAMTISTCCLRSTAAFLLMCVCHTSPAVASVSLTLFYHSGRLPRSRLRLFRCATSPAMSLLSLTVISDSRRRLRIPPPRHTG